MTKWEQADPKRLLQLESTLLALCDRVDVLERAFSAEHEAHRLTRKRLDFIQSVLATDVARLERRVLTLQRQYPRLLAVLERKT